MMPTNSDDLDQFMYAVGMPAEQQATFRQAWEELIWDTLTWSLPTPSVEAQSFVQRAMSNPAFRGMMERLADNEQQEKGEQEPHV